MSRTLIAIDDPDDPRIAAYRDIRERDLVGRQGRFVAEGRVVLNVLFSTSRFAAESVFLRQNRVAGLGELIDRIPAEVPVYVAGAEVMDRIAGFEMHRGVLAIGRKPETDGAALLDALPPSALVVALSGIANHDNMGSIFRNAASFGADAVLMTGDCCDPLYRKAIRVSVGAALKVPFARFDDADALAEALEARGFSLLALSPRGARDVADIAPAERQALLLGSEGHGLSAAVMERLPTARIAMTEDFDSLNVAAASAIALHRLWRAGR
ncbi:TrmH family RNA methyltransferase [Nitratireductor pacificus]|uniref:tRNA/rRNA methyltransferase SpoU n=1 Tax=Nitratireductor pacificus pht-3B TaxID=391937 RepID=K2LI73_9HYPH|nr:RNA methyltransferase [Nitratireductor pacificus]EKF17454.1 tRNA/rRNA methyltransferase SpoU [Nitratireductor pacificus pht-3B]